MGFLDALAAVNELELRAEMHVEKSFVRGRTHQDHMVVGYLHIEDSSGLP